MPKINKKTLITFPRIPSLKIYQFENSTNYFCNFYVGTHILKSGNKEKSLKTKNVNEARKKAKEEYYKFFNSPDAKKENNINFDLDVAQPFFKFRIRHYKNKNPDSNQAHREQQRYENYIKKFFEDIDYRNVDELDDAIEEIKENLKQDNKTDNTISKYFNILSLMFKKALDNNVISKMPYFPPLKVVNQVRHSYQNSELNLINRKLDEEYKKTEDIFYADMKDYINLIRSAGFRPGLEPLRIKMFQCEFVLNRKTNLRDIYAIKLLKTKTGKNPRLFCHPFFTQNILPEILNRHQRSAEDFLLFPNSELTRRSLYAKIGKTFTRLSKELSLYYRGGTTRPLYSIRHTFAKNNYISNAPMKVIAKQMNTSERMLQSAYLDDDDILLSEEFNMMYPNQNKTS